MRTIKVEIDVEIPDIDVTYEQLNEFIWFYICQEGGISHSHPLYDAEYTITDFNVRD